MKLTELRRYRNSKLYRPLGRVWRVYNRRLVAEIHARGFTDFAPSFPSMLSNLDTAGTRIGVLAERAGVTRQAAGQLIAEIERCGYVERTAAEDDARATTVVFTARGRRLLDTIFELVEEIEESFATTLGQDDYEHLRATLSRLADAIDPMGGLGPRDEPLEKRVKRAGRRPSPAPTRGRAGFARS